MKSRSRSIRRSRRYRWSVVVAVAIVSSPVLADDALPKRSSPADEPPWVESMKEVHAGFEGRKGYVAQLGDSITHSMAFWSPIGWDAPDTYLEGDDGLPKKPAGKRWRDVVLGTRAKGPRHGNYSGWRAGQVLEAVSGVLEREHPEVAIIMVGTNDISGGKLPPSYRASLEKIVRRCLAAHCVPILNTIPPRRDRGEAVVEVNRVVRDLARELRVPLADYYAACLRIRPGKTWDGAIISKDGVHPTAGKTNVYTEDNMKKSGYALRNWVNFLALRELYFRVLEPPAKSTKKS